MFRARGGTLACRMVRNLPQTLTTNSRASLYIINFPRFTTNTANELTAFDCVGIEPKILVQHPQDLRRSPTNSSRSPSTPQQESASSNQPFRYRSVEKRRVLQSAKCGWGPGLRPQSAECGRGSEGAYLKPRPTTWCQCITWAGLRCHVLQLWPRRRHGLIKLWAINVENYNNLRCLPAAHLDDVCIPVCKRWWSWLINDAQFPYWSANLQGDG